jgi:hypothetical protein
VRQFGFIYNMDTVVEMRPNNSVLEVIQRSTSEGPKCQQLPRVYLCALVIESDWLGYFYSSARVL